MKRSTRMLRDLLTPREQAQTVALLVALACGAALEIVSVTAIPAFVALLSNPQRLHEYVPLSMAELVPRATSDAVLVLYAAAALLAVSVVKNVTLAVLTFVQNRYVFERHVALSTRLLRAYLYAPYTFHLQRNTADLLRNVNHEATEVISSVVLPVFTLALEGLTIVAIMAVLLAREPVISLFAFVLLGAATGGFIYVVRKQMSMYGAEMHHRRGSMIRVVNESLGSVKITKVLGREPHFLDAFAREAAGYSLAARFRQLAADLPRLYLETTAIFGLLGVAALLLAQHRPAQSAMAVLSLFAVGVVRMVPSFNRVTGSIATLRYGRHSLSAVHADLTRLTVPAGSASPGESAHAFHDCIRFNEVSFAYPGAVRPALDRVSIEIRKGSAVGVVGPTGSGKTTLVDLILGLLEPTEGRILIDGHDVRHDLRGWQRCVGYVPQDVYLTDDTIRRNVALGLDDAAIDERALRRAVEAAQLREFIDSLPAGVETVVGERGVRLSGGQRQRIGIARALYNDPGVLIMDEATSALDGETERFVMEAVDGLRGDRTIIMIAHRISTVRNCDALLLLSDGVLACSGTYEQMLASSASFRRLAKVDVTSRLRVGAGGGASV